MGTSTPSYPHAEYARNKLESVSRTATLTIPSASELELERESALLEGSGTLIFPGFEESFLGSHNFLPVPIFGELD